MHERGASSTGRNAQNSRNKSGERINSKFGNQRVLQYCAFTVRATITLTTKCFSSHLIFNCDMITHQKEIVDWELLWERKIVQKTKDNECKNRCRSNHVYQVREKVLIVTQANEREGKLLKYQHKGPYKIMKSHNNGTVKIHCGNFDKIHILRLQPFYEREQNNP